MHHLGTSSNATSCTTFRHLPLVEDFKKEGDFGVCAILKFSAAAIEVLVPFKRELDQVFTGKHTDVVAIVYDGVIGDSVIDTHR
jgi:hypothetical protein